MTKLLARLSPGDGAIDVGANVGSVTTRLAKAVGPQGRVLALEPDPKAAGLCRQNCAAMPWVTVQEVAVTDHDGTVPLYVGTQSVHGSLAEANVPRVREAVTVACDTLDHLAASVPNLAAIKIDAQGAEVRILSGASALLRHPRLVWVLEIWPLGFEACGTHLRDLCRQFADHGWSVLATGKQLEGPPMSWAQLEVTTKTWKGQSHTNVLIGRT